MHIHQQSLISGLTSDVYQAEAAGVYSVYAYSTVVPPSGLVITISQTGSTSLSVTSQTTSPVESVVAVNGRFNCALGDLLTVAVTSSAAQDQPPNLIKTFCTLKQGV